MFSTLNTRTLGSVLACLLPFISACGEGFIENATIDPESIVSALTPTVEGLNTNSPGEPDKPDENTGEVAFLRSGLEDILGHNKLELTYTSNEVPPVTERYFFAEQNITLDEEGNPVISKLLTPFGSGVFVLYMELGDGNYGIHAFGHLYPDKSLVVSMFASEGEAEANGIFVFCLPSEQEELAACIASILTEWDGLVKYQRSLDPIAFSDAELSGAHVTNPAEATAWMQYSRESNPKVQTHAAFEHEDAPAAVATISAVIGTLLSQ